MNRIKKGKASAKLNFAAITSPNPIPATNQEFFKRKIDTRSISKDGIMSI
jgi:uncharacterized short protein YbdD (DUF466 family)